ncbi:hypothetical protein A5881_003999 [Enterococcus termitis]|nr:hypothetical protein A5881_003978 [Enterococcus termitis]
MEKITQLADLLSITKDLPKTNYYRGENMDYGDTSRVATAVRDSSNYDMYDERIEIFSKTIREQALFDNSNLIIPFAQHSGLATKLLDVTSNPLVAIYFACQQAKDDSDGFIYVFNDYANITPLLEKYPSFDLENELLWHLKLLDEQRLQQRMDVDCDDNQKFRSVEHDELELFGKCIEGYRQKYLIGGFSKHSIGRGISEEDSPFKKKHEELRAVLEGIKTWVLGKTNKNLALSRMLVSEKINKNAPAIDFIHPYKNKRYEYYNEQYQHFDLEVKEYLISLECIVAFINDRSSVSNLSSLAKFDKLTMDFLPNFLYSPVLTFKRGLSQQSSFFVQTIFDKHAFNFHDPMKKESVQQTPRQLLNCQANYDQKIIIDGKSKVSILTELDKIGVNKATMFGDADNIAAYIQRDLIL